MCDLSYRHDRPVLADGRLRPWDIEDIGELCGSVRELEGVAMQRSGTLLGRKMGTVWQ